ncbi:sensor histidine kinase [Muricauda sp. 2012CJ35-5]|uniref:histidine kinase n=1 Tax=Flagellimonas spongiicola TaxID=2942208 RepID=A0ABT0PP07_9FLAO|nr:ATP-binding protein [Allomuricauda spongiicola]MCL6273125.1 sensor histidine kinase [Allomuricauda spongiicola]
MKYSYFIFLFVLLMACGDSTGTSNPESNSHAENINVLIDASRDSAHLSFKQRTHFLEEAKTQTLQIRNDTTKLDHLSRISLAYKRLDDSLGFRNMNAEVLQLAIKSKLYKAEGESYWDMAAFQRSYGVMDSAYYYYQKAYKSFSSLPSDSTALSLKARILYSMGSVENFFIDYLGAEQSVTEALRTFIELKDQRRIYNCNNLLGMITSDMGNYESALEYYSKAGETIRKLNIKDKSDLYRQNENNIAHVLLDTSRFYDAEIAYRQLIAEHNLNETDLELYPMALVSLAYSIFKGKNDTNEPKELLNKALISFEESEVFNDDYARGKQYYAEVLAAEGDTINARLQAKEGLDIAIAANNNFHHLELLRLLTHIDTENAVAYSDAFYDLSEVIKEEERTTRDKFARIRLETDQVIARNETLTRDKFIWTMVALALLFAGVAIYIILAQRVSNNRLKFQQKQQKANNEIYNLMLSQQGKFEEGKKTEKKRVSEELHDSVLSEMLSIRLFLSGLNADKSEEAEELRAKNLTRLQEVEDLIRTISHEMNNSSYEKFYNFIVSLKELVDTTEKSSGVKCSFNYEDDVEWDALEGDIKINSYRIVQESLKNSVKHAQCKHMQVNFSLDKGMLYLTIQDDGVGFVVKKGKGGIGMRNLASRAEKIGGNLQVVSEPGKGTEVLVKIPARYVRPKINLEEQTETVNA